MRSNRSHPVVHLELHTGDLPGARSTFADLCGWPQEHITRSCGSYLALELARGLGGGIVECVTEKPLWVPYVQVPDLAATMQRARDLGHVVLLEPREGPAGRRAVVATAAGGEIAFWQPKRRNHR